MIGFIVILTVCIIAVVYYCVIPKKKAEKERRKKIAEIERKQLIENYQKRGVSFVDDIQDRILSKFPGSKVLTNVVINNGRYTKEIELIALTTKGFFVVECKNYIGCEVTGKCSRKNWECTYPDGNKYHIYNPILQLNSAIWNLKKYIGSVNFDKVAVFSQNCKLSEEICKSKYVYHLFDFDDMLGRLMKNGRELYNENYVIQVAEMIEWLNVKEEENDD